MALIEKYDIEQRREWARLSWAGPEARERARSNGKAQAAKRQAKLQKEKPWLDAIRADIRLEMASRGWTQNALAARVGVHAALLIRFFRGDCDMTPKLLRGFSVALPERMSEWLKWRYEMIGRMDDE
ncbi:MAG: helix-turn-helix transcriptional regulator [Armatimonadota bacterium]|nr:helix-turn-helix transcriptional regulator [Armatimonadota bacterium]